MVKAVIFDLDGLLIDSEVISYKIYQEILSQYGYEFSKIEYAQNYSGKTETKNINYLIRKYNLPFSIEKGLEMVLKIESTFLEKGVSLKRGAKELLAYLKKNNYKTAIASSSIQDRAMSILKQHNLTNYFDEFVFGHEVENGKPSPDIFLKACEKLSEEPYDCLILEDSEAGIQAGFSANIPVICIPDMKKPEASYLEKVEKVFNSLDEVIKYLTDN